MGRDSLIREAESLNIPTESGIYKPKNESWKELAISDYELHRRIQEEKRHRRENSLWWVALCSALASLISAIGAWAAVISH